MASIFDFLDYRKYLREEIQWRARTSSSWSTSRFATRCGFRSQSAFRMMLARKRNLAWPQICRMIDVLQLSPAQAAMFEAMVWWNQAKDRREKTFFQRRFRALLHEHKTAGRKTVEPPAMPMDWRLGSFILICNGSDEATIQEKLPALGMSWTEAQVWIPGLVSLGFLYQDGNTYRIPEKHLVAHDARDLKNFQKQFLLQSVRHSQEISSKLYDRGMKIYAHTIESTAELGGAEILHKEIIDALGRWTDVAHPEEGTARELYQINIQLFNVKDAVQVQF